MRAAVFLDRDGVINRPLVRAGRPFAPSFPEELELLPSVPEALRDLKAAGFCLVVVTNQPDVARGATSSEMLSAMHERLQSTLPLDAILACVHDEADQCECRKPRPGLITRAARQMDIDCAASYLIGDRWRDMEAGRRAGCRTFFIDHEYDEPRPQTYDFRVRSLREAANIILRAGASP